ncbi:hypothetical protein BDB01DRAFT_894282 [Pilobolus umbonatus]|nr:hypothetical protein BDB01DRAFT_894282 [Pilobolus umbonatus]
MTKDIKEQLARLQIAKDIKTEDVIGSEPWINSIIFNQPHVKLLEEKRLDKKSIFRKYNITDPDSRSPPSSQKSKQSIRGGSIIGSDNSNIETPSMPNSIHRNHATKDCYTMKNIQPATLRSHSSNGQSSVTERSSCRSPVSRASVNPGMMAMGVAPQNGKSSSDRRKDMQHIKQSRQCSANSNSSLSTEVQGNRRPPMSNNARNTKSNTLSSGNIRNASNNNSTGHMPQYYHPNARYNMNAGYNNMNYMYYYPYNGYYNNMNIPITGNAMYSPHIMISPLGNQPSYW